MLKKIAPHEIIAHDWSLASADPEGMAAHFYARLFEMAPETAAMFGGTDMKAQGGKLATALGIVVRHAADVDRIAQPLADLGRKHMGWGVRRDQYDTVGAALIATLQDRLGADFDDAHVTAWVSLYGSVVALMHAE